ncbi:MAG TPA: hypothetical protein VHB21_05130 [Minicystis sp.]|nr:hypothetical protein [Minicystis sp.]
MEIVGRIAALAAAALLVGCGGSVVAQGPSDTLRGYAQALEQGRVDDAYRMLSDEAKRSMSLEAFRRSVKDNPQDAVEIAQALARPASDPVITASVTVPNGDELLLVYEGGKWRIDAAAVDLYGQSTPRQALMGFLRAFERKRYDVILRYVPDAEKQGLGGGVEEAAAGAASDKPAPKGAAGVELTAEKLRAAWEGPQKEQINRIVQAIRTALPNAQIEETGDSASMAYGAGGTVAFVREHGVWKIKDF